MVQTVAMLGLGLIGGSLCRIWRKARPDLTLIGYDLPEIRSAALHRGFINRAAGSIKEAVAEADLVVLATPIGTILTFLRDMAPHLKPGAWVTDVGSVKTPVVSYAGEVLRPDTPFIGGHPMAGSERMGLAHADPLLFENATYILCPPENVTPETFETTYAGLIELIRTTGARILLMDAERHDTVAAAVSHLPQLLAVTLMNVVADLNDRDAVFLRLAAGGFRDMTRIAASPYEMWRDILTANEGPILDALGRFAAALQKTRNRVFTDDDADMEAAFRRAQASRSVIPKNSKGFLHPLADVYVYAEDKPGFLHRLTGVLHEAGLNIKDLELLKIREGVEGAFRIGFTDEQTADIAVEALRTAHYTAYRM